MNKKILVTGNPKYGLAQGICSKMKADFISRSNGFDLTNKENQLKCVNLSLDYDVFINSSALYGFNQVHLLQMVYERWEKEIHRGHIINLGSTADVSIKGTSWVYPIEKKALKAYSKNLSMAILGGHGENPSGIRVSYISPGHIKTESSDKKHPHVKKIDPEYLAEVILWVIKQPEGINISEMALDPIQPTL